MESQTGEQASHRLVTEEILVNMGPQHPSTHGVLRVVIRTDGEIVRETYPHIGYLHRCAEKIAESVPYPQFVPYTDRLDYLASINNNFAYCASVEKLAGIEVPERAEYLRVVTVELNRIASHLIFFATFGLDMGAFTPLLYGFREREFILDIFEKLCGARLTYHYVRIGGVMRDITPEIAGDIRKFLVRMRAWWKKYNTLLSFNHIFIKRVADVGIISGDQAIDWGLTGPALRASGVNWDLRKDDPYSIYDRFEFDVPVGDGLKGTIGDCWNRYWVRMREIKESLRIIEQALDGLPEGDIRGKVPKVLKPPEGEVFCRFENPRGELGFYIISDGSDTPYRVKIRAPSFCTLSIMNEIARECLIADIVAIIGSFDIVLGEVDR